MLKFIEFCHTMDTVSATSKRKEKIEIAARMLQRASSDEELTALCYFSIGTVDPEYKIGVGWRTIRRVVGELSGRSPTELQRKYREDADFGRLIEYALSNKRTDLTRFLNLSEKSIKQLFVDDVSELLKDLAKVSGEGSTKTKNERIRSIFSQASPTEAKYIARLLTGDSRTGFRTGMLDEAIAVAFEVPSDLVRRARMLLGDSGDAAIKAKAGVSTLRDIKICPFRPVAVMLAEKAENISEALIQHNHRASIEPKMDGIRAQLHSDSRGEIRIYSRLLEDITSSFPELVEVAPTLRNSRLILDGEIVAFIEGKPVFFQDLVKRKRTHRSKEYARRIPCQYYAFDILYKDGDQLIDAPYSQRREILASILPVKGRIQLMESHEVTNTEEVEQYYNEWLSLGYEGAMLKAIDGPYLAGRRGAYWLKLKREMELDLCIVGAERGHGRRTGWLSDYFLAAYDKDSDEFVVVGKTFKGLTDAEFQEMTRVLENITIRDEDGRVLVTPKVVVKVIFEGIQSSKRYKSGLALRFARISEIRRDKNPIEVDSMQTVQKLYDHQFKTQTRV